MKVSKIIVVSILILALTAVSTACGYTSTLQPLPSSSAITSTEPIAFSLPDVINKNSVTMTGLAFQPAEITIQKGETITWTNKDAEDRDVVGSAFKSELIGKDETYSQAFNQTGVYNYTCSVQSGMIGRIIVK